MLSHESAATVRATLPVVQQALEEITGRFYATMFADNPDLLGNLFNRGNQASGTQRQALAGSIAAFATLLLDRPDERPDAMLSRIAHKHASLGVTPTSTRSCTNTSSPPSPTCSATPSPPRSRRPGTRSTG